LSAGRAASSSAALCCTSIGIADGVGHLEFTVAQPLNSIIARDAPIVDFAVTFIKSLPCFPVTLELVSLRALASERIGQLGYSQQTHYHSKRAPSYDIRHHNGAEPEKNPPIF